MQGDTVDSLAIRKTDEPPALAAIDRFVDTAADGCGVTNVALAGTDPDDIGVGLIDGERADGGDGFFVEHGLPGHAAVIRQPDTTGSSTNHNTVRIGCDSIDGGDATADRRRAQRSRRKPLEQIGVECRQRGERGQQQQSQGLKQTGHPQLQRRFFCDHRGRPLFVFVRERQLSPADCQ